MYIHRAVRGREGLRSARATPEASGAALFPVLRAENQIQKCEFTGSNFAVAGWPGKTVGICTTVCAFAVGIAICRNEM